MSIVLPSLCLVPRVDSTCSIVYGRLSRQSNCPDSLCNFWMNPVPGIFQMCDFSLAVTSVRILGLHRVGEVAAEGRQPTVTWPQMKGVTFDVSHSQGSGCVTRPKFVSLTHFYMSMDAYMPTHCIACSHIHLLHPPPPPPQHAHIECPLCGCPPDPSVTLMLMCMHVCVCVCAGMCVCVYVCVCVWTC